MKLLCPLTLLLLLSGCSLFEPRKAVVELPTDPGAVTEVELYLSRTTMTGTAYERYSVSGDEFFIECGEIRSEKLLPVVQEFEILSQPLRARAIERTRESVRILRHSPRTFSPPGKNSSLFDPGKLMLSLETPTETSRIETSLDFIALPKNFSQETLRSLTVYFREIGTRYAPAEATGTFPAHNEQTRRTLCGRSDFFGVPNSGS